MKDFFDMTRRERQGTILLLALISMVLMCTMAVRSCRTTSQWTVQPAEIQRFESECDSSRVPEASSSRQADAKSRQPKKPASKRHHAPAPDKRRHEPRRLDPVPQF